MYNVAIMPHPPQSIKPYHTNPVLRKDAGHTEAFARLCGVSSGRTVRRWESGEREIQGPVVRLIEALALMEDIDRRAFIAASMRG